MTSEPTFARLTSGTELGASPWVQITQAMIDAFAQATLDDDPMHTDPVWARDQGPFGHTVSYGFLTMSLLTHLVYPLLQLNAQEASTGAGHFLNYGFDKLRFVAPVPVNSEVRAHFAVADRRVDGVRTIVKFQVEMEIRGGKRPALVAEWLTVWIPS